MLSTLARPSRPKQFLSHVRWLTTEPVSSSSSAESTRPPPPPAAAKHPSPRQRTRLRPSPRPTQSLTQYDQALLPHLPPNFGQNQLLSVDNSTRALLESIVNQFNAPIRYAFAYGSGVFEQDGYNSQVTGGKKPMLDFIFAVRHPDHWHSINMHQHPSHYPIHARTFGSDFVTKVQEISPGVWFNAYVKVNDVTIKYGVTSVDNLCADLLTWQSLYLAGRMHKPLRIIRDDARVRLTQQVNLTSALRAALLTLPSHFSEYELFERISSISYDGDPRMLLPAENRSKVQNIVRKQEPQFRELYRRLALGLDGVHWPSSDHGSATIEQDVSPQTRAGIIKKLPSTLSTRLVHNYSRTSSVTRQSDESEFFLRLAADENLPIMLRTEMRSIVRYPAMIQTVKGLVSSGLSKSIRYSAEKVGKWWSSSRGKDKVSS